jgi:hypothetical protein
MQISKVDTAVVFIDPHNEVLSDRGLAWGAVGEASIIFRRGITSAQPGSIDRLVLAVYDIDAARGELLSHGVAVSEVFHDAGGGLGGGFHAGTEARVPGPDPQGRSYASYASFSDPDATVGCCKRSRSGSLEGRRTNRSTVK